jgi:signal transduction histidine kinase/CheY-like chemotaxis protein/HAMP domain-containing protein
MCQCHAPFSLPIILYAGRAEAMTAMAKLFLQIRLLGRSFQAKLMLLLLLPLLVVWTVVVLTSEDMLERQRSFVGGQQLAAVTLQAAELDDKIKDRFAILAADAAGMDTSSLQNPGYAGDYLARRFALRSLFSASTIVFDKSGTVLGDYPVVPGRKGQNFTDRDYLPRLFSTGQSTVSEPFVGRFLKTMLIALCVPIQDADHQIKGALCGYLDVQSTNLFSRLSNVESMGDNTVYLVRTSNRMLIASTDNKLVMSQVPDTDLAHKLIAGTPKVILGINTAGVEKLYASALVPSADWVLAFGLPTDIAYAPVRATVAQLKRGALAASLLLILVTFFLTRRLLRPLQNAEKMIDAMSSGRESLQRVEVIGDNEIRSLLTSFNRLSDSVTSQQVQLKNERNALVQSKGELSRLNQELEAKVEVRSEKLMELNTFLHEVLETLPFGVVVLDRNRQVILRNKLFGTLLDYPEALLSKETLQFDDWIRFNFERGEYPGETLQNVLDRNVHYMMNSKTIFFEKHLHNGVHLEVRGQPLSNGLTLLTYTDITAHNQVEHTLNTALGVAESATTAKSAFIANMSHEIRTPMNAILGLSYLLEKSALPGGAHDMVVKMRMAGTSLLSILNDVLDFSKIESGKLNIQSTTFCLGDVLDNLATIMSANLQEKDLELIISPTPNSTDQLIGDSLRLEQVLINLTGNAIKFTERGHVALSINQVYEDDDTLGLRFGVRDSGIGIAPDKLREIFAEFSQADGSTSRNYGGTGLGLTISHRLVAAMGGELAVTSELGVGSEFWFELRFQRTQEARVAAPEMTHISVLIADDSAVAREALCTMVESLGWAATAVSSGDDVVEHLASSSEKNRSDKVLLLDFKMPGKDGLQTAHAVRTEIKNHTDPIVILVTPFFSQELLNHPHAALADAILSKPVTSSTLYNAVSRAMRVRNGDATQRPVRHALRLNGLRMLVVDDSEINREVAQHIFAREGAHVLLANQGQEAVNWLRENGERVDIVLMDVQMPVLNGYEATRQVRLLPALAKLPIVALTAGAFQDQQELAQRSGMTGFLAKPFDVEAAIALIIELTGHIADAATPDDVALHFPQPSAAENLPGISVSKALEIWRDAARYQQFLRQFAVRYADIVQRLRDANSVDAQALAHKFRGAAGSLALEDVAVATLALEHIWLRGDAPEQALMGLQQSIKIAFDSIARYAPPSAPTLAFASADHQQLAPWLSRLLTAWQSDSSSQVAEVLADMDQALPSASREFLQTALDNYDFRGGEAATGMLLQAQPTNKEIT